MIPSVIDPILDEVMVWRWVEIEVPHPGGPIKVFDRERRWVPLGLVVRPGGTYASEVEL